MKSDIRAPVFFLFPERNQENCQRQAIVKAFQKTRSSQHGCDPQGIGEGFTNKLLQKERTENVRFASKGHCLHVYSGYMLFKEKLAADKSG